VEEGISFWEHDLIHSGWSLDLSALWIGQKTHNAKTIGSHT
jgi:hypothetical protein